LVKANRDLEAARILLEELDHDYEAVGFHAQQAAEKYLKALPIRHQVEFCEDARHKATTSPFETG